MWHKCKGFDKGKDKGKDRGKDKGKRMRPSKRWKVLAPKGEGKGEGKGKTVHERLRWEERVLERRRLEFEAFVELERLRLEEEARACARARAEYLRSMNPWRWIP